MLHQQGSTPQKNTKRGFNLPTDKETLRTRIGYKYLEAVRNRGNRFANTDNLKQQADVIAGLLTEEHDKYGIFINGYVGAGKSTMAKAIQMVVNEMVDNGEIPHTEIREEHYMAIVNARDMVKSYIRCHNGDEEEFRVMKSRKWLVIDDLGTDQKDVVLYGTVFNPFLELLDYRYEHLRPTIIVSNLTTDELRDKYEDPRLIDRMREMFSVVSFKDSSFRA